MPKTSTRGSCVWLDLPQDRVFLYISASVDKNPCCWGAFVYDFVVNRGSQGGEFETVPAVR